MRRGVVGEGGMSDELGLKKLAIQGVCYVVVVEQDNWIVTRMGEMR